jgi:thiamine biosynthesis lipoprotein
MKKTLSLLILIFVIFVSGCSGNQPGYTKYSYEFLGVFDTVVQFIGYAKNQDEFKAISEIVESRFIELNRLYDIYNDYEGISNIKTINDNAGIKPVEVSREIIDLILFSKQWYNKTNKKCNIALGAVLSIWHDYREEGTNNPEKAKIPPLDMLQEANKHTDIEKVIVDEVKNTVYLEDEHMRLDVGAVAKGYASELVANELKEMGYTSFIISSGGNVKAVGQPMESSRNKWGIGLQDPDGDLNDSGEPSLDILYLSDQSLVTSGDYQRYYIVDGKHYHHLIDPVTLMPSEYFRAVSVMTEDSGLADFMSTTIFLTPYEEGKKLAESVGVDVIWMMNDGTIEATDNAKSKMKYLGGARNTD